MARKSGVVRLSGAWKAYSATARPDEAMTLAFSSRFMPAMPMADSKPPMVVGDRQTSSATSMVMETTLPSLLFR